MGFWFCFWVCCVVLFVCVHVSCYILHLFFLFSVVVLCSWLYFVSCFFVCVVFSAPLSLPRLTCSLLYGDWVWLADGRFFGDGGWGGGARLNARRALCVSSPLAGGDARMLWLEKDKGSRDRAPGTAAQRMAQVGSRRKKHCRFSWQAASRDLVACTAHRTAQIGSRRKKNCRFPWQAAEISCQAQHRGWRKVAQEGKKCRFRGRHSKEAKDSKGIFIFVFEWPGTQFVPFNQCRLGLLSPLRGPMKKRTRFLINVPSSVHHLNQIQCMCGRQHTRVQGSESGQPLSTGSQFHPGACVTVMSKILKKLNLSGHLNRFTYQSGCQSTSPCTPELAHRSRDFPVKFVCI